MKFSVKELLQHYKESFERGVLPYIRCTVCNHSFYYPRDGCPKCGSVELALCGSCGSGTIFSYTTIHRKGLPDSVYAIVELKEGFRMYTNLVETPSPRIGLEVRVTMRDTKFGKIPYFRVNASEPDIRNDYSGETKPMGID